MNRRCGPARLLPILALPLLLCGGAPTPAWSADSFVVGLPVEVLDSAVDTLGITYVLGRDAQNRCVLLKYDSSGARLAWSGDGVPSRIITNVNPVAFCVRSVTAPGATNLLYIVGNTNIVRVNADTGKSAVALGFPAGVSMNLRSICCVDTNVYVCGTYSGTSSATIFGKTASARGSQAGLLIRLNAALSSTALALTTFGGSSGGNTAESLAVDENGDVYVSGHFGSGGFNLDGAVAANGQWKVDVVYSSSGVGSLNTALDVLNGSAVLRTNSGYYDKINFGPGSSGNYGSDAAFPGGGGDYFVTHATGTLWISTEADYEFRSTTDDGTRLQIDGATVLSYTGTRSADPTTGTVHLTRGLHTADYIHFENDGAESAELTYRVSGGPYWNWAQPCNIRNSQNKAFVVKFNNVLTTLKNAYFTASETTGSGGTFREVRYAQGWVYATGSWRGTANNPALGLPDSSINGGLDIDIVKLDTNLKLKARATVKGTADNEGYSLNPDGAGNVYVTGSFGVGSVDFVGNGDRDSQDPSQDRVFTSLSSPKASLFTAKLNSNLDYEWVDRPVGTTPDSFTTSAKVRWNTKLQRLFWTGYFVGGSLTFGQSDSLVTLNGTQGFLTVLDPDGTYTELVYLTVVSDYGQSGTQVLPFGGPLVGSNPTATNRQQVIKGAQITTAVPPNIYRASQAEVTSDLQADTRIRSTGYSVDNNVPTGGASSYTFVISKDTIVTFNWAVDFALQVDADLSATVGTGDPVNDIPGIAGITSLASGSPVPSVQKHWIAKDETVIATIDSELQDLDNPGLPVKYVVTGYDAFGPPNTLDHSQTNFFTFAGNELRRQVPGFVMDSPAVIRYHWKLKIGVQVNTTGTRSTGFPLVLVIKDPGQTNTLPPIQLNGQGSGTFYFDEHTQLEIGTILHQGASQLSGWLNGDGFIFNPLNGTLSDLNSSFTRPGTNGAIEYVSQRVPDLVRPARVMWNYGDRIFEETVYLGNAVTFKTVDDSTIRSILQTNTAPDRVDVVTGPPSSIGNDMATWDAEGKKYYPLRPGTVLSYWLTTGDAADRVIIRLVFKYPAAPHYRHIANTVPVVLDPITNDPVRFLALKYTEATAGGLVDNEGKFTATGPGNSVLLFGINSSSGRGGVIQTLRVRVVESRNWTDQLPDTQTAVIGQKLASIYDTAGLGTGYTLFQNARYNPFIYQRDQVRGPIIPVNLNPTAGSDEQLVVVWFERRDQILWPYQAVRYEPVWPTWDNGLNRIVMASRYGSESVAPDGTNQLVAAAEFIGTNAVPEEPAYNPARFQQVQIYHQPDRTQPGYNPNEEHALMAPSLRSAAIAPQPMAAYALRDGDLNVTNLDASYTSDPYVLVQFYDSLHQEFKMKVYEIVQEAANLNAGDLSYTYTFTQQIEAGEPVVPFYPLPAVIGATPCDGTYGKDGQPTVQRCYWRDHKGAGWAVSGDSFFNMYFFYPLTPEFWWPTNNPKLPGDCVAWLPEVPAYSSNRFEIDYRLNDQTPAARGVVYYSTWPESVPVLKVGETLTFPGGEYHADHPTTTVTTPDGGIDTQDTPGLPGVVGWASGEIVFDSLNPLFSQALVLDRYTARMYPALEERRVSLPLANFPSTLLPATQRTKVKNGNYVFVGLSSSLQKRIFYDPINGRLVLKGLLNDKTLGDATLTASPPAVYVLEPNILTPAERAALLSLQPDNTDWTATVEKLYLLSRNPSGIDYDGDGNADDSYDVGVVPEVARDAENARISANFVADHGGFEGALAYLGLPPGTPAEIRNEWLVLLNVPAPQSGLGPGLALTANAAFLDPANTNVISYITMAENNDESLGTSPVVLHVIKVDKSQRYRGAIKTILSDNVFDENIVLRHTADFGGNADDLVFEWWYRPEDGTEAQPPDRQASPTPWKLFADTSGNQGRGFYQLTLKGNPSAPEALLADSLFFMRYRHKNEFIDGVNWEVPQTNGEQRCVLNICKPGIPYDWAGAGNSSPQDLNQDGLPDYRAQLAQGWIKRVLDRINVYEARINDFSGDNPATYSSIIRELGAPYVGPVALNPDKDVIENVGLIALYETILQRGRDLSIDLSTPISTPSIANALELAATRLSDFYTLLGNEAYSDAQNPTIGFGSDSVEYGSLAPSVFAFQNQVSSQLEEELALLRGIDANNATPVYNRLFWNFTKGEGEAAYAMNYNVIDANVDGFIDENDAMILHPQGHGDAWGHYLTALKMPYDLLLHPYFNWVSRSEYLNLQDIVIPVDYLDERKFARTAAAKAQAGAEVVNLTYREKYVADPLGQWQGYLDTDVHRGWGVEEWARRAGQGAYFDWVTANALLPAVHPNTNYTGIQKVDRTTVQDIAVVAANLVAIQTTIEQVNNGNNPLGLANGALVFDLDPTFLQVGSMAAQGLMHFDQIYQRALAALNNAKAAFDNANRLNNMIRQVANSEEELRQQTYEQDLAYRNQLIEIFGTPYDGTIGTGKAYPAGYTGPDTMLFMYVDQNNLNDETIPQPTPAYFENYLGEITGENAVLINGIGVVSGIPNSWKERYGLTFLDATQITNSANYTDFANTNIEVLAPLPNLNLPIMASGYTFVAPTDWGMRSAPGELQNLISEMVQAQADLNNALGDWDGQQFAMIQGLKLINSKFDYNKRVRDLIKGQMAMDATLAALKLGSDLTKSWGAKLSANAGQLIETAIKAVPQNTPTAGVSVSAGDALAPIRCTMKAADAGRNIASDLGQFLLEITSGAADLSKNIGDAIFALAKDGDDRDQALIQDLTALQFQSYDEMAGRVTVFRQVQVLRELSDRYRAKLAEGMRLIEERTAFNKRVAAQTQMNRYQDMTFRVSRNAALEKYRSAFELAARYAYLAASTYDYDLNLAPNDPGSPVAILADIVRQRNLGILGDDGEPAVGGGGLAEAMAMLKANYENLKPRMGLNNPQIENITFSLRTEFFRILPEVTSDTLWRQALRDASVSKPDLWQVPEFRRFCRPFSSITNGPQPGLVISFSTQIRPNRNLFGWPMGGRDSSYDPSVYATKINSVGVWFANYDEASLPQTPRVYLIPVGQDVMTVPNDPDLSMRLWSVLDQNIPIPYPSVTAHLNEPTWKPLTDSLDGRFGETRRFSSFRAYGFDHDVLTPEDDASLLYNARLVGRSVWNTKWMLIIPGATLSADPGQGLDTFINSVRDIKLVINSYGFSGN